MQNTYDFTIKYEGTKAKRFMPGPVSYGDHDMLALLRNDLKSLGVNLPKRENVHIRRGGVVAVTTLRDTGGQYTRYKAVSEDFSVDMTILKRQLSIASITLYDSQEPYREPQHSPTKSSFEQQDGDGIYEQQEYRLTLIYSGAKAKEVDPDIMSHKDACKIFDLDLKALGLWVPANNRVALERPGSIYGTFLWNKNAEDTDRRYRPYAKVTQLQSNTYFSGIKKTREIRLILLTTGHASMRPPIDAPRMPRSKRTNSSETNLDPVVNRNTKRRKLGRSESAEADNDWFSSHRKSRADAIVSLEPTSCTQSIVKDEPKDDLQLSKVLSKEQTETESKGKSALVNSLSRNLWDTRREISAAQEREVTIQNELFALTRSRVTRPEPLLDAGDSEVDKERKLRVEAELKLQAIQYKLNAEIERRIAAEDKLKAVELERKKPFEVPAILEAFLQISYLADSATGLAKG